MSSPPPSAAGDPPALPANPPRKFPAPCWTQEETLALINAYQDKWYSLRRRNLRTADWDAVAADVSRRCPDQSPAKTSAQCRHKMEKLRKRYRTEKQKSVSVSVSVSVSSLPYAVHNPTSNRLFSSSWIFFDLMESMESGSGSGSDPQNGFSAHKPDLVEKPLNSKNKDELGKYFDEILMSMGKNHHNHSTAPIKFKVKNHNHHNFDDDYDPNPNPNPNSSDFNVMRNPMPGLKRKSANQNYERIDSKRESVVGEMVNSIKMLGEGLMRMEKMKMEMMREIETMRMEMEMKRSQMIIESQQLIVNAFVEGFKNKKLKVMELD